jgi:hypothetical protein
MEVEENQYEYNRGYATLRSSTHTLTYSKTRKLALQPNVSKLFPLELRHRETLEYNVDQYTFIREITRILLSLNPNIVGYFPPSASSTPPRLETFHVPPVSLRIKSSETENASECLTKSITNDAIFMNVFDSFVCEVILPYFKRRLHRYGVIQSLDESIKFFYQRPPTLRIQPGPSLQSVMLHRDGDYGHQDGELNFWLPLTHRSMTQTELWVESEPDKADYNPVCVDVGQVSVFHGTSCRHYVPPNKTPFTRISLDFRVGIEDFYDPTWKMRGTKHDHYRKAVDF